ncbi:MAG: hypothetical protein RL215_1467 [Planctomycetota bacterium]
MFDGGFGVAGDDAGGISAEELGGGIGPAVGVCGDDDASGADGEGFGEGVVEVDAVEGERCVLGLGHGRIRVRAVGGFRPI